MEPENTGLLLNQEGTGLEKFSPHSSLDSRHFVFWLFEFVSNFGFRASDLNSGIVFFLMVC